MVKKFKVHIYSNSISIHEDELPKAIRAQITGEVAVFSSGSVRGSSITLIEPDYHHACGFNYGHRLTGEDWKDAKLATEGHNKVLAESSQMVKKSLTVDNGQKQLN